MTAVALCSALAVGVATASVRSATAPHGPGTMTAMFARSSYAPGEIARLRVVADADQITVQLLSVPPSADPHASIFHGPAVGRARTVAWRPGAGNVWLRIGRWPSGIYFARVRTPRHEVVAPVVVRPARLDRAKVAVIVPTFTWQAYNLRHGNSWYVCTCVHTVDLARPYLNAGVPYNFGQYDQGLFAWLARNHQRVAVLADEDFNRIASGAALRRLYRMVVFDGHGEYATGHMFDITEQYRDRGGHLAFLSANDFFRDVLVNGNSMTLIGRWRDLGRPEAALIGSQYLDWYKNRYPNRPYVVVGARKARWLFAGTGLRNGSQIRGHFGIEIDHVAPSSPPQTEVIATIPNIFPGETAQMTYYTTRRGAEVFNAGTINFGGAAHLAGVSRMLGNLWRHMAGSPHRYPRRRGQRRVASAAAR
jgi:N,N-dimethylformamidase beta subunit-like, C-terminal